jgi:nucleotide-binding universal stress UspA family protein/nitrite reductase/ring-hydroxylating ferredoxin subunit
MERSPVFPTILLGTDGSPSARTAEQVATMLARAVGGGLLIVSAYQGDAGAKASAERTVEETRPRVDADGVYVRTTVVEGEPAAALVETADREDADLIVIGDIGMGPGRRLRLGGVPDRISHTAPCSVLIVRTSKLAHEPNPLEPASARYKAVLIATDGSPTATHAVYVGAELAKALGASITLVHAGDDLMGRIVLKDSAERLDAPELPQRIATGEPGKAIAQLAEAEESDLVVVGNKGIAGARRVLGSVPNTVSHATECDVLIVHTVGRSLADLKPGEGAIVEEKGRKLAGYRDSSGQLIALSRKCTHLGCSVQWNSSLKTWDCPCHGSRYDARGKVMQGPAPRDLERLQA